MEKLLSKLFEPILEWPRVFKRMLAVFMDAVVCVLAVWLAFYLRLGDFATPLEVLRWPMMVAVAVALPLFVILGLYRAIFRFAGSAVFVAIGRAVGIFGLIYAVIFTIMGVENVPRSIGLLVPILVLIGTAGMRGVAYIGLKTPYTHILNRMNAPAALIYGAGNAGSDLARALVGSTALRVVGMLDDDPQLQGGTVQGLRVFAPEKLPVLMTQYKVRTVLLAMPHIDRARRSAIVRQLTQQRVGVRTLPTLRALALGGASADQLQELDVDDLLGRDVVEPDAQLLALHNRGRVVLITGAGGSIGSELCRQVLAQNPAKLLLVEQSEFALYTIHQELNQWLNSAAAMSQGHSSAPRPVLVALLADVRNAAQMGEICRAWQPHTVYHAAAYKHVPLVEENVAAGLRNNVWGTLAVAQAAQAAGAVHFVLISTDKAVRPTNIMGASKRLAELVLQALAAQASQQGTAAAQTTFSMVRFGNVLGSSGSVVPLFRQQIRAGGPVTLTHEAVTRYFMTIPEAAQLVIQAAAMARGGEVFVLDMGEPVQIAELARRMIWSAGLSVRDAANPHGDIAIAVTGLRPGEKLYEELLIGDNPEPTTHPRILRAREDFLPWPALAAELQALDDELNACDIAAVTQRLRRLVSGYVPEQRIVDWLHGQRWPEKNTA